MAECPECGAKLKVPAGKLVKCPKCDTKFRAPAEGAASGAAAKSPGKKPAKAAAAPSKKKDEPTEDMYGFSPDEVDLVEERRKREEKEKARAEEAAKVEKPVIEVKRKNIGDLERWEVIDRSLKWFTFGIIAWGVAHFLLGVILFLGIIQGPDYAGPVVNKLISHDQPALELGAGDSLDRPSFIVAMLGGLSLYEVTLTLIILIQIVGWIRMGMWATGCAVAWPSAPEDVGGKGQLTAIYSLMGFNFLVGFFFVFLPMVGLYNFIMMSFAGAELAMAETNMERSLPIHIFWSYSPFWETFLSQILIAAFYFEPLLIGYFLWCVAFTIKDEVVEKAALGTVKMGMAVLFLMLTYQLFAIAGTSSVLVNLLRLVYLLWYIFTIAWMMRLAQAIGKVHDMFKFYFHPDED